MGKIIFFFLLLCCGVSELFSQSKLIQGTVFSEKDSSRVDSALVILYETYDYGNYDYDGDGDRREEKKVFLYSQTDSNGVFSFRNIVIPKINIEDSLGRKIRFDIEIISAKYHHHYDYIYDLSDYDSLERLVFYICPFGYERPYPVSHDTSEDRFYSYANLTFFAGSLFDSKRYDWNYKIGFSYYKNYRITKANYLGWEIMPISYRRYSIKNDSVNTLALYSNEYFASIQSGAAVHFRTQLFSWKEFENAVYIDLGAEYVLPWHYWYVGKPDKDSKLVSKNFHKYNEMYLNARIGMMNGVALKGQYRFTDIFKGSYVELPKWSVELQWVFFLGGLGN